MVFFFQTANRRKISGELIFCILYDALLHAILISEIYETPDIESAPDISRVPQRYTVSETALRYRECPLDSVCKNVPLDSVCKKFLGV